MGMLQIKNFPDELKEKLAKRAKDQGTTMSALVIDYVWTEMRMPTMEEWWAERSREMQEERVVDVDTAAIIRAEREEREEHLAGLRDR